jgi:hypothetical protein
MSARIIWLFVLLAFLLIPAHVHGQQILILEHANVVNPLTERPLYDQTIVLSDGKIQSMTSGPTTLSGEKIDLKGAWLLPAVENRLSRLITSPLREARSSPTLFPLC